MKNLIISLVILGLLGLSVYFINRTHELSNEVKLLENFTQGKTDTVYSTKTLKPLTEYKIIQVPTLVTYHHVDTVVVDSIIRLRDTIRIYSNGNTLDYNDKFFTNFPTSEKLIQMELTHKKLNMSLVKTDGNVITKGYKINTDRYDYNYANNQLTTKKRPIKFVFEAEALARPFTNMYDINIWIGIKTGKFSYVGGINTFYYPGLRNSVGVTPILGVKFTL